MVYQQRNQPGRWLKVTAEALRVCLSSLDMARRFPCQEQKDLWPLLRNQLEYNGLLAQ